MDNYFVRFKQRKENTSYSLFFNMSLEVSKDEYAKLIESGAYEVQWGKAVDIDLAKFMSDNADVAYGVRYINEE